MKYLSIVIIPAVILLFSACDDNPDQSPEKRIEAVQLNPESSNNAAIIRNPISASGPMDTVNVAKMTFDHKEFDFGRIDEGEVIEHDYTFVNTGKVPLVITSTRSTCGCTVPEHPKDPVPPGESGSIKVRFNSKGRLNQINKPITVVANTFPKTNHLLIKGYVEGKED
jgi:hypothetical protein